VNTRGWANIELVDRNYLGDMLSVDCSVDAAVPARIRTGWNKFRQLSIFLTAMVYSSFVRRCLLHGSETWPMKRGK